jgi:iron complex outermembrane receptor protein
LIQVGQLPADSVEAIAAGAESLTEEEAVNISIGITSDLTDSTTLTIDAYQVEVDGRIYKTTRGDVSFFTNAIDVEHQGIDVVLTHDYSIGDVDNTLVFAYTHGEIEVTGNKLIGGVQVVSDDVVEDIETSYPEDKFTLTSNSRFGDFNLMLRARYFGDHYDQRGNIAGTADFGQSQEIDPVVYVDLELNYDVTEQFTVALGGSNIFDEYPDEIKAEDGVANRAGVGLPYPRYTPAGYEGGSWYVKARYNF